MEKSASVSVFFGACVEPRYTQLMFATLLRFGIEGDVTVVPQSGWWSFGDGV
jgi:hypothetical protein